MNIPRPHVVCDCNVLLQAMSRPDGPARRCLRLVTENQITLFLSRATLREFRRVLTYPEFREKNPQITDSGIEEYVAWLLFRANVMHDVPRAFDFPRDHGDEPYLDLALAANADYLITRDKDLLSLSSDCSIAAKEIRQRLSALRIVTPAEFLAEFLPPT
jgi:uncharacterized protein